MDRTPHADTIGGHGPADRASDAPNAHDRATRESPSYVEAVLFGKRRSSPPSRAPTGEKAGAANEQERN
jgi:hypothetical protein